MHNNSKRDAGNIEEFTMDMGKVNLIALLMLIPILTFTLLPYALIWGFDKFNTGRELFNEYFIIILVAGIIVHELLHGITWSLFAPGGLKSIKFGIVWKYLTPYCHCKEALKVKHYKIGAAMPLIILGIIPVIVSLVTGNSGLLIFGIIFTWAAGGDITGIYMMRKLDCELYVYDHPNKLGFIIKR